MLCFLIAWTQLNLQLINLLLFIFLLWPLNLYFCIKCLQIRLNIYILLFCHWDIFTRLVLKRAITKAKANTIIKYALVYKWVLIDFSHLFLAIMRGFNFWVGNKRCTRSTPVAYMWDDRTSILHPTPLSIPTVYIECLIVI